MVNCACVCSLLSRASSSFAIARSTGKIECLHALCLFFWFVCFSNRSDLCKLMLNAVVFLCCEWRVSSVRICFVHACLYIHLLAQVFLFFLCVDSCALCFTERKHELTRWNCGYRAHRQSMSSGVHNLVEGGVKQNKPSTGPTNSKQNVYGRQISTLQG
jgi:hypothetical protein